MQNLILVRHGDYNEELHLSKAGAAQMLSLAKKLAPYLGSKIRLLTSSADRAKESAEILGSAWDITPEEHAALWSQASRPQNLPRALALVERNTTADTVVVVTHLEYVENFPRFFAQKRLNTDLRYGSINKGEGGVIDCEKKTFEHVR